MFTFDTGDSISQSYLMNISTEHSPNTTTKRVVIPSVIILDNFERETIPEEIFSSIIFCEIYATTSTNKVVLRPDIFSPDYM